MLPSMPLITSNHCKEGQNEEFCPTEGCSDDQNLASAKALDLSVTAKKSSPMKHVTPILKKYNSHRKGKGGKKMGLPCDQPQYFEKHSLRRIVPKPTSCEDPNGQKDMNEITTVKHEIMDSNDPKKSEEDKKQKQKDNEDEMAALMLASTTIKSKSRPSNVVKKRPIKQVRDMEACVTLLTPDDPLVREEKSYGFAQAYFLKVKERLQGTELYHAFLHTMNEFGTSIIEVTDLYHKVTALLSQHPDLSEEFLAFLLPEQAMQCGKFMEYLMITKMRDFFRRLEIYFEKQPQQMRKFYSALTTLGGQANVTVADVRTAILPLLKGNSLLVDNFLNLLPYEKPPESMMTDFEELDFGDKDSKRLGEDEMFETLIVPNQRDAFGGDGCACNCHNSGDDKYNNKSAHCLSCGTRFIHGKIFLHTGKVLRPAKVAFDTENSNESMNRLSAKNRPKVRTHKSTTIKLSNSPLKHARIIFEGSSSPKGSRANKAKSAQKPRVSKSRRQLVKTKARTNTRTGRQSSSGRSNAKSSNKSTQSRNPPPSNTQVAAPVGSATNAAAGVTMPIVTPTTFVSPPHSSPDAIPLDESAILPPVVGTTSSNMKDFSSLSHALQNALDEMRSRNVVLTIEHSNSVFHENVNSTDSSMRDLNSLPVVSNNLESEQAVETSQQEVSVIPLVPVPTQSNVENFHSLSPVLKVPQIVSSVGQECEEMDQIPIGKPDFSFSPNLKYSELQGKSFDSVSNVLQSNYNEPCVTEQNIEIVDPKERVKETEEKERAPIEEEAERIMNTEETEGRLIDEEALLPLETCIYTSDANDSDSLLEEESNADNMVKAMEESSLVDDKNSNVHPDSSSPKHGDGNHSKALEGKAVNSAWTREEDKVILLMYKLEHSFQEISEQLPQRSVDEIKCRFELLISIMKQMTEEKMDEDSDSAKT